MDYQKRPLVVALALLISLTACKPEPETPGPAAMLDSATTKLAGADFDQSFDQAIEMLDALEGQTTDKSVRFGARLARGQALLELWLAVLMGSNNDLYEKLQGHLSLQLDGEPSHPRNFQIVSQTLLEDFRLVVRESETIPELKQRAEALAAFAGGLQGILFRGKADYFLGRDAIRQFDDLTYLADLTAVRDLVVETLIRNRNSQENWQNIVLTVYGRICPKAAAHYLTLACTADAHTKADEEFCHTDFQKIPESRRVVAKGTLTRLCVGIGPDGERIAGLPALRTFYDAAFTRLLANSRLRPGLKAVVEELAGKKEEAYKALELYL